MLFFSFDKMTFELVKSYIKTNKSIDEVKQFIDQHTEVLSYFGYKQQTIVDVAICFRDCAFIKDLITTYKLKLSFAPSYQHEPYIFHAYDHKKFDVIEMLLELGADPNERDEATLSLLITAATDGNVPLVKLLLKHGADVNFTDVDSANAAIYAAKKNHTEMLKLLIENGIDINHADKGNVTPLMHAALLKSIECVRILIENGANVNDEDNDGLTALNYAELNGTGDNSRRSECVELIKSKGGKKYVNFWGLRNRTTIHQADD